MSETTADKKKRERSKAYPGANLETCAGYVAAIKKSLGKGVHDRDSLAKAMGFDKATGAVNPKIAALVHFGWLDRAEGGYQLSVNAQKITDFINEAEKKQELRLAFCRPTLYQEILAKFESEKQIPTQLATHLHRFHGITDSASSSAAEIFVESGRFAGWLDAENKILSEDGSSNPPPATQEEVADDKISSGAAVQAKQQPDKAAAPLATLPHNASSQRFEFSISGGRTAVILVPAELNSKDIKIIRKQIELLELQAGLDEHVQ